MRIRVVYLAAGFSRRFGENKLLYPLEGKPMYRHLLERWMRLKERMDSLKEILVVTRAGEVFRQLEAEPVTAVINENSQLGISSSLKLGLMELPGRPMPDAYVFSVADQPYLREETLEALLLGYEESGKGIGAVSFQGEPGNPVIFSRDYREALLGLKGDRGGKGLLRANPQDVWKLEVKEEWELRDLDLRPEE